MPLTQYKDMFILDERFLVREERYEFGCENTNHVIIHIFTYNDGSIEEVKSEFSN